MMHTTRHWMGMGLFAISCFFSNNYALADDPKSEVQAALADLDSWLGKGPTADGWHKALRTAELRSQLDQAGSPNAIVLGGIADAYQSGAQGLDKPRFARVRRAIDAWLASTPPAEAAALAERANRAKSGFRPVTQADVDQDRKQLDKALADLDKYLGAGPAGQAWRKLLNWDELTTQFKSAEPDFQSLLKVLGTFEGDQKGLDLPPFVAAAQALRRYLEDRQQLTNGKAQQEYEAAIDTLAAGLTAYDKDKSPAEYQKISDALGRLERRRQAPRLVAAVRRALSRPNLLVQASEDFISAGMARRVTERAPVRDMILGTSISGTGTTEGIVKVQFIPDPDYAVIEAQLDGVNYSRTVGRNGPALVYTRGTTELHARKRLTLGPDGIESLTATADARARSRITGIGSTKRGVVGCLVEKIAARKAPQQKGASERVASRHAEERAAAQFEQQAAAQLIKANETFQTRFRNPLLRRGEFPSHLHFSTTDDLLQVSATQAGRGRLASTSPPPTLEGNPQVAVRMHESLINNLADGLVAGETIGQQWIEETAKEMLGKVPDRLKDDPDKEPWTMTLADRQPVTFKIEDSGFKLTVRGKRFTSGDRKFDAMDFTLAYKLVRDGKAVKAVREGEIEIYPPGFVRGSGQRMSQRQILLRDLMRRRLTKLFEPEMKQEGPLTLPGEWAKVGPLEVVQMGADGGWLTLGWRQDKDAKPAVTTTASN